MEMKKKQLCIVETLIVCYICLETAFIGYYVPYMAQEFSTLDSIPRTTDFGLKVLAESSVFGMGFTFYADLAILLLGVLLRRKKVVYLGVYLGCFLCAIFVSIVFSMAFWTMGYIDNVNDASLSTVFFQYDNDSNLKLKIDEFQVKHQCCGVEHYSDWNVFRNPTSVMPYSRDFPFPESCCEAEKLKADNGTCLANFHTGFKDYYNQTEEGHFVDGCRHKVDELYQSILSRFFYIFLLAIVMQIGALTIVLDYVEYFKKIIPEFLMDNHIFVIYDSDYSSV